MIRPSWEPAELEALCEKEPERGCLIMAVAAISAGEAVPRVWAVGDPARGVLRAALAYSDEAFWLCMGKAGPDEELFAFLEMQEPRTLWCSPAAAAALQTRFSFRQGVLPVLRFTGAPPTRPLADVPLCELRTLPELRAALALFAADSEAPVFHEGGEDWLSRMSRGIRRGQLLICGVPGEDGALAATACVYGQTARTALIANVLTAPAYRGQGLASRLVHFLAWEMAAQGKTSYIVPEDARVQRLYEEVGFARSGAQTWLRFSP